MEWNGNGIISTDRKKGDGGGGGSVGIVCLSVCLSDSGEGGRGEDCIQLGSQKNQLQLLRYLPTLVE